ncbi:MULTISPECIES: aminoimidazole riboside kinase [Vibrionaceae]|uniref:aminoimidazole riboside kinase n=1 Tax=Vibrionaceae TaxID=641 RepID=UPI000809259A|nr:MULTISPECIES: aminoimidazole riboside kinase [Vibrionaceae]ANS87800.1 Fructokinase [Vibrio scophthalmi]AWK84558.1 aminoimidazole riboside kinase [Photobacterium damselae]MBE8127829.1 aminoimidazole riboside kinase [Photobacterium damselae subsp. piscicida]TLS88834.1 aminoimidazole riboside kinase [Photobacterium damselae subsp. damselae]
MNQVWVTGDAVVDLIQETDTTLLKCPGGAPANVAVAISRLLGKSAFFGRIGNDPFGTFMVETLQKEGVNTENLVKDTEQRTSTVVVDLDDQGERSFTFMVKPSADQFMSIDDIPEFKKNDWLHVCSISLANEPSRSSTFEAIRRMKATGGYISFDPNLREEVWKSSSDIKPVVMKAVKLADVVKFSEEELGFLTDSTSMEQGLANIAKLNNTLVLVTQGAKGVWCVFGKQGTLVSGRSVNPVDTTGAGDAFVGGLLAKLSQNNQWNNQQTVNSAIQWANACGALATTQKGAMTALPTQDALVQFITPEQFVISAQSSKQDSLSVENAEENV